MAEIGLAVAQTLFAALECNELKNICAIWGYESQLKDLSRTVTTIKKVLMDSESKVLSYEEQEYIYELKDALYEADDLFDEFVTLLELEQLETSPNQNNQFFQKVCHFFSSNINHVCLAVQMFQGVTRVQNRLNAIVDNHIKFSLDVNYEPICKRREETCSYVDVKDIIGRDSDKNFVIGKLLESKDQHVRFLTIVGVGGLGKTALAQLVYNDERLKQEFGKAMYWVCVSDQDKTPFEVKPILCMILESVLHQKSFDDACSLDRVQKEFQDKLGGKKYFLVLDDLWNEDRKKWVGLETLLKLGRGGSRILVTTRSEITSRVIGNGRTYRLPGLSRDNSWNLFEKTAFDEGSNHQYVNHSEMVKIGKNIVQKCNNIPLAIKVVGSLLFHQGIGKWRSFEKSELANIDCGDKKIMSVLKFSYHNLRPSLKSCFAFCAVFPKDFVIKKGLLISLWMAQGYIVPLNRDESVEDVAEENFKILLRRCFFQDVKRDKNGEIESVKIHDLMHDVAQEVGGEEFQVLSSTDNTLRDRTRHVFLLNEKCLFDNSSNWSNIRTLVNGGRWYYSFDEKDIKLGNWKSIRVLELTPSRRFSSLLNTIGELQHLRYLDLSHGAFEELPNSITKLHNLEKLLLEDCSLLRQLPHNWGKLIKLHHLNLCGCKRLVDIELGLNKLKELGAHTNLTGRLKIDISESYRNLEMTKDMSGGYLSKIPGLKEVRIVVTMECVVAEAVLEKLEPHPNLRKLELWYYGGRTIPWWRSLNDNSAKTMSSNLVNITIEVSYKLVSLPSFSKLPFLKSLILDKLYNLEYMETSSSLAAEEASDVAFFPSLQTLHIRDCPNWKGGWMGDAHYDSRPGEILSFPCLSTLEISGCDELTSFPPCQSLQSLRLHDCKKLKGLPKWMNCSSSLHFLSIKKCNAMESLPEGIQTLTSLQTLHVEYCKELKGLPDISWLSSLQSLTINACHAMESLLEGIQTLTSLRTLNIEGCRRLFAERFREPDGEYWPKIQHIPNKQLYFWDYFDSDFNSQ